jgi:hypothetical protein
MSKTKITSKVILEKAVGSVLSFFKEDFLKDSVVRILIAVFAILFTISLFLVASRFIPGDYYIPLKYNSFLGVTKIGKWYEVYRLPLILATCFGINTFLADKIYQKDRMITYILLGTNIFIGVTAIIAIYNFGVLFQR